MLLAIDVGNTNIVFAVCDNGQVKGQWRMATDRHRTADEYVAWLMFHMERAGITPKQLTGSILASVVPDANFSLRALCHSLTGKYPLVVGDADVKLPMKVKIDNPQELGADRLVNAIAAWDKYKNAHIIIDFGTATTFDVVDAKGDYIGGVIAPGVNLSLEALQNAAAKLPSVAIKNPGNVIGKHTISAMQSGIYFGYIGLIEGIVARISKELGQPMPVVATGGLAPLYAKETNIIQHVDAELTIRGLQLIYAHNKV